MSIKVGDDLAAAVRPIHLLHDSRVLARMLGIERPCCEMVAMPAHGPSKPFLAAVDANPCSDGFLLDLDAPSPRFLVYSGSMQEDLFADEPRNWMPQGQARFQTFLDETTDALKTQGRTMCLRPHWRHALGDLPSCVKFVRERITGDPTSPFELCLSPVEMLAPSMLQPQQKLEEHLQRMFTHLGGVASCVLLADFEQPKADGVEENLKLLPLGAGCLRRECILPCIEAYVPKTTPILLLPGRPIEHQLEWLSPRP